MDNWSILHQDRVAASSGTRENKPLDVWRQMIQEEVKSIGSGLYRKDDSGSHKGVNPDQSGNVMGLLDRSNHPQETHYQSIDHTTSKISKIAQLTDSTKKMVGLKVSDHTPKRVSRQVDQFTATAKEFDMKKLDSLPEHLRLPIVKAAFSVIRQFRFARERAVEDYDSDNRQARLRKHQKRHDAQDRLEELNIELNDLVKVLGSYRYMDYMTTYIPSLEANREVAKSDQIESQRARAMEECENILNQYEERGAGPDKWREFHQIVDWFKKPVQSWQDQIPENELNHYLDNFFKNEFIYQLLKRGIDPAELPSTISRQEFAQAIGIKRGEDVARAFTVARGKTIEEKSKRISTRDTRADFRRRYSLSTSTTITSTTIEVHNAVDVPYKYNVKRLKNALEILSSYKERDRIPEDQAGKSRPLPHSEITYHVFKNTYFFNPKNIKKVIRRAVTNQDTQYTRYIFQNASSSPTDIIRKGTDEYYAMLGTKNVLGIVFLLAQHKREFQNKEIMEIKWEESFFPDIKIYIGR